MQLDEGGPWGAVCGDGWGVREAMVSSNKKYLVKYFIHQSLHISFNIFCQRLHYDSTGGPYIS